MVVDGKMMERMDEPILVHCTSNSSINRACALYIG
jgi:hypothetical protein